MTANDDDTRPVPSGDDTRPVPTAVADGQPPRSGDVYQRLDRWVDEHFDEEVRFLQELVRVPTDTPPGHNAPHAERTAEMLGLMGLNAERHKVPEAIVKAAGLTSITNLIVRHRFGEGPTIALNAHGDVVPPG